MATLLLAAAGSAIGGAMGGTVLGMSSAVIGQAIGAAAGRMIDARLLSGSSTQRVEGPRLDSLDMMASQEGAGMPSVDGRTAIAGEVIWATRFEEVKNVNTEKVGGKGTGGQTVETTSYEYFASFAVGICEGPIRHFGRVWADGRLLDTSKFDVDFYKGTETQAPDPLIVAKEGGAPAYRGLAYVVFKRLPLADYGNRIPQIRVEVWGRSGTLESLIRGVDLIPGSTEWGYMPDPVRKVEKQQVAGEVAADVFEAAENCHRFADRSDWHVSLDMLTGTLPAVDTVALVVAWFGTDLRAGLCRIEPRVETAIKATTPVDWSAAGLTRATATVVSQVNGRPAFGSSPADLSIVRAIKDLRRRGKRVVMYPFVMMDVPASPALPDPDGSAVQGAYPWRGRIRPRAGQNVASEVSAFLGSATAAQFSVAGEAVSYTGPAGDWGFRRFILHLAALAKAAGGVDAFLCGSEMVGMTTATPGGGSYPFVSGLKDLVGEVKTLLPGAQLSYAADWSEYHSHRPGGGEVYFHLDPLWSDPNVAFVGIDNYFPLSDWRDGTAHLDYDPVAGKTSIYNLDYLKSQIEGGEYWDWYYASQADRDAQRRTPISDHLGEPWVWRQKAVRAWHGSAHRNRPGGVRSASATAWVPGSKPVWFTEIGCPSVDKGANQPNLFPSEVSSEGAFPYYSSRVRDDFMPRQYLRASLEWWRDNGAGVVAPDNVLVWAWDARPWPEFPLNESIWADGPDWTLGHWLNGRAGNAPAAESISRRLHDYHGLPASAFDVSAAYGQADGYAVVGAMPFGSFAQPWEVGMQIDASESGGKLTFRSRRALIPAARLTESDFVDADGGTYTATRGAIEDVARQARVLFSDGTIDYRRAPAVATIEAGPEDGVAEADLPLVLDFERGTAAAEAILRQAADGREVIRFALPPSRKDVRVGGLVTVALTGAPDRVYLVNKITRGEVLGIEARAFAEGALSPVSAPRRPSLSVKTFGAKSVSVLFLDLPAFPGVSVEDWRGYVAAHAAPWPGGANVLRSSDQDTGYSLNVQVGAPSMIGNTAALLPVPRYGTVTPDTLEIELLSGALVSRPLVDVLSGKNVLAVRHPGGWEVLQYVGAELVGVRRWRLSGLIRGQRGTDAVIGAAPLPAGAAVVVLDRSIAPVAMTAGEVGRSYWWKYGPAGADPADYAKAQHAFRGIGRRPFRPAHLRAARAASGDLALSWVRRTRVEGDAWPDTGDVPLGESSERYRVEVGPSGAPVRVAETASPAWTYTAAMQAADGLSAPFAVRVSQLSETFGRGPSATITVAA